MQDRFKSVVVGVFLVFSAQYALAEPWLANRFAQNCAGCHAPGRKNLPAPKRRCTLSCQGCHVNPNGGGLRSNYGKWNEDRWLKSYASELLGHKGAPAPYTEQKYAVPPEERISDKIRKRRELVSTNNLGPNEADYDREDGLEMITSRNEKEFLAQIPREDPYQQNATSKITAGADVRWQLQRLSGKKNSPTKSSSLKSWKNFLMTADVGVDWRPVYRRYHLVYEGRYLGSPTEKNKIENAANTMIKRSLYAMADDLPYNSFVMAGFYKPAFGYGTPDHTILSQRLISQALQESPYSFDLNYEAVSIGSAPNVPYLNIHLINRQFGPRTNATNRGLAATLGARFVTLGASANYSFWQSQRDEKQAGEKVTKRVQMHSIGMGIHVWRVIANLDLTAILKDVPNDAFRKGVVATLDTYTQLWRQYYFTLLYSQANISEALTPGKATQFRAGIRSFIAPGVDMMVAFNVENLEMLPSANNQEESNQVNQDIQWQLHLYL